MDYISAEAPPYKLDNYLCINLVIDSPESFAIFRQSRAMFSRPPCLTLNEDVPNLKILRLVLL
jgi:hypothetical protein